MPKINAFVQRARSTCTPQNTLATTVCYPCANETLSRPGFPNKHKHFDGAKSAGKPEPALLSSLKNEYTFLFTQAALKANMARIYKCADHKHELGSRYR